MYSFALSFVLKMSNLYRRGLLLSGRERISRKVGWNFIRGGEFEVREFNVSRRDWLTYRHQVINIKR